MLRNIPRTLVSIVWVSLAFGIYLLFVTPWIDRPERADGVDGADAVVLEPAEFQATSSERFVRELSPIFPEGSWELDQPTVLRSPQATILLKEFEQLQDGSIKVVPCTLVFYGKDRTSSPTILQARDGAILRFDTPVDLANGEIGKPIGGQLVGPIRIFKQGDADSDDLELITSEVMIDEQRVWTRELVEFRFGQNRGVGRDLMLTRAVKPDGGTSGSQSNQKGSSWLDDMGIIELQQLEELKLQLAGNDVFDSIGSSPKPSRKTNAVPSVVDVSCDGPLRFDLRRMMATVEDNVRITRLVPNQPRADTLQATQLSLHLSRVSPKNRIDGKGDGKKQLSLTRIVGVGAPLIIDAATEGAYVETKQMEYSFRTRQIKLRGYNPFEPNPTGKQTGRVLVRNAEHEIVAPAIDFVGTENPADTKLVAAGPGQYSGQPGADGSSPIAATWNSSLSLQPYQGQQVLKIDGKASVRLQGAGAIRSDVIELWLQPQRRAVATRLDGVVEYETTATPVKLISHSEAGKRINIASPQFNGTLKRLTVLFESGLAPKEPNATQPAASPFSPLNGRAGKQSTAQYRVDGGELTAWVDPTSRQLHRIRLDGDSRLVQEGTASEDSFEVVGDNVDFHFDELQRPIARLLGKPARLTMAGMQLTGEDIRLHGDQNRVVVPGRGSLRMPLSQLGAQNANQIANQNNAAPIQMVDVEWQEGLQFDGQVATLTGEVVATGTDLSVKTTDDLVVVLDQPIDFSALGKATTAKPKLARITARGGVVASNRVRDVAGQPTSYQHIVTRNWDVDFTTGDTVAEGPGWLAVTSPSSSLPSMNGQPKPKSKGLSQLSVAFANQLTGNIDRREAKLEGDVRGWFGPVENWEARVDPLQATKLGENDFRLSCREVIVMESPSAVNINRGKPNARKPFELFAIGNTYIESERYAARGAQIKYAEDKGMLTLEGDQQRPAEMWQRTAAGGPVSQSGQARRIKFRPGTGELFVEGMIGADLSAGVPKSRK